MGKVIKIIMGFVVLGVLLGAGIYFFAGSSNSTEPLSSSTGATANSANISRTQEVDSNQFLSLLLSMSSITLDESLFSMPTFRSLRDFSATLTSGAPGGRPNPFAPIGQDASFDTGTTYTITTAQPAQVTSTGALIGAILPKGLVPTERWFEWGTSSEVPFENQTPKLQQNLTTGTYSYQLSNLSPDTIYYVRAAARIGTTQFYGTVVPFQTQPVATPTQ